MYGMVNKAVQGLVCSNFGEDKWAAIRREAKLDVDTFISNEGYDDSITYNLVGAASKVLGITPAQVLFAFGEYWVLETARKEYGDLLTAAGRTLPEFLDFLPAFHIRVALIYPHLKPPRFETSNRRPDRITMHYYSDRPGLSEFVRGLFSGLGKLYSTPVTIEHTKSKDAGADHDEFVVSWPPPAGT